MKRTSRVHHLVLFGTIVVWAGRALAAGLSVPSGSSFNISTARMKIAGDLNVSGIVNLTTGSLNVSGNWSNPGTFTAVSGGVNVSGNWSNSGTFTAGSGSINVSGNWSNSGTFTAGSCNVTFTASSGTCTISAPPANGVFNNLLFNDAGGSATFSPVGEIEVGNNLTINAGTLDGADADITVRGNWDNNDIFFGNSSTVIFNSSMIGRTIEAGSGAFHNVTFDNAAGSWTVQTDNMTVNGTLKLAACTVSDGFVLQANRMLTLKGAYVNSVGEATTAWGTGTILNVTRIAGGVFDLSNRSIGSDTFPELKVGADTHVRMWDSSASTYTVDASGSLYSMDHAGTTGDLYIWGNYSVPDSGTDYWSLVTDFDGTGLSGGSERQVNVRLADGAHVTCGEGETLEVSGNSSYYTTISRQGASGTYGVDVINGTLDANRFDIQYIDGDGLNLSGSGLQILKLDYGVYDNSSGSGSSDAFITLSADVITNNPGLVANAPIFNNTNAAADFNVRITGTTESYWSFQNSGGLFDGESFDSDPGGDPGYAVWDDSAIAAITVSGIAYDDDDEAAATKGAQVGLAVNDVFHSTVTTNAETGAFSFSSVSAAVGDTLTLFFNGESFSGSTVAISNGATINTLKLYKSHVLVRSEGVGAVSIVQMAKYDKDQDADINFDAEDTVTDTLVIDDGSELFIPEGEEFQPLGNLQSGNAGIDDIDIRGTLSVPGDSVIRVSGSWYKAATATFEAGSSTVCFDAASGPQAIDPGGASFHSISYESSLTYTIAAALTLTGDLTVSNGIFSPGSYTLSVGGNVTVNGGQLNNAGSSLDVDGDIVISSGTLTAPTSGRTFTVGGNWSNTGGTFTSATGKVTFNAASGTQTLNAGGTGNDNKDFYDVQKTGGGTVQVSGSGFEADGTLTISSSTVFDLNGQSMTLAALNNAGTLRLSGAESAVSITAMDTAQGTVEYAGDNNGIAEVRTVQNFGALDYYDLSINDQNAIPDTFRTSADIAVNHNIEVLGGTFDISTNGNTLTVAGTTTVNEGVLLATGGNIDANSDVTVTAGTFTAPGAGKFFRIAGSLSVSDVFTHSTGTVTFDASSGTPTVSTGGNDLYNVVFDDTGNNIAFTLGSAMTVNDLTITGGTLDTGSNHAITVGGNWTNDDIFISKTAVVTFNKASGNQTIDAGGTADPNTDFQTLTKTGGGTLQLSSSGLEVDGTFTVAADCTLELNGKNLNAGTLDNSGTVEVQGPETVSITTHTGTEGTVRYVGDGDASAETFSIAGFGGSQYCHLTVNDINGTPDTFEATEDIAVSGDLTIDGGTLSASGYNVDVDGSVNVASGTLGAPGTGKTLTIGDDLTVAGQFTHNSGGVVFDDYIIETTIDAPAGGLEFNNLICSVTSKVLKFAAGDTFTVSGAFTMNGQGAGTRIVLQSTQTGTQWNLILNGTHSVQYVNVSDSNASGTATLPVNPTGSYDSGNNGNWFPMVSSPDANALRAGGHRHTFYDGSYFWAFYIDENSDVVYKRDSSGTDWSSAPVSVAAGTYSSLGIWEDGTNIFCSYGNGTDTSEKKITIATQAQGTERILDTVADYHMQTVKDTSGYLHRKSESSQGWIVTGYQGTFGSSATATVDLTPAVSNLSHAFIISPAGSMSVGRGNGGAQQNAVQVLSRAVFVNPAQVLLTRGSSTGDSAFSFFVVDDTTGQEIYAVNGTSAFTATTDGDLTITTADVPALADITNPANCVVFLTVSSPSNAVTRYNQACVMGWVNANKGVELRRTSGNIIVTVDWHVVEFKGAGWTVQQNNQTVTTGTDATPQQVTINSVTTENSFVYMNWNATTNGLDYTTLKAELVDATHLNLSRQDVTTGTCTAHWWVISHPNLRVQRGSDVSLTTDSAENQAITSVDTTRAFPLAYNDVNGAVTTYPQSFWRAWFSSPTSLDWDRSYTGQDSNFRWQVIEMPRGFFWSRSTNAAGDDSAWNAEEKIGEDTSGYGHLSLVPLESGKVMALYNDYDSGTYYLRSRVYSGGTWGSEQTVVSDCNDSTAFSDWDDKHYFSAVSDDVGYVYVIYANTSNYINYTFYNGTDWLPSPIPTSDAGGCSNPSLSYDSTYETVYAFWLEGTNIRYKQSTSQRQGYWQTQQTLRTNLDNPRFLGTSYNDTVKLGAFWREGADSYLSFDTVTLAATIVDLVDFYGIGMDTTVKLLWRTASEIDNAGFHLYRSTSPGGEFTRITASLIPGLGTSVTGQEYVYDDTGVTSGQTYYYILESVEDDGTTRRFGPAGAHPGLDTDSDGISDDYEYYYGLDPSVNDAAADYDGDGLSNAQEYAAASDPFASRDEDLSWTAPDPGTAGITVISNSTSEIILELVTNSFDTDNKTVGADTYQMISFPEYSHGYTDAEGKPMLPLKGILLSMQNKLPLNVTVIDYETESFAGYNVYPVPQKRAVVDGGVTYLQSQFYKDNIIYARNALYPGKVADIDYSNYLRGQSVARLVVYPLQYNPVTQELVLYKRVRVKVTTQASSGSTAGDTGGSGVPDGTARSYKIPIDTDGIYRLSAANLTAAGIPGDIDPRTLKLYNNGVQVPMYVLGESDGTLDSGDYLEFFGEKEHSRYTYDNVYCLVYNGTDGERMEEKNTTAGTVPDSFLSEYVYDLNQYYWSEFDGVDDPWYLLSPITAGGTQTYTVELPGVVQSGHRGSVSASLRGYARYDAPSFYAKIYLNNYLVDDISWTGNNTGSLPEIEIPAYWITNGTNTVKIEHVLNASFPISWIFTDWFNITYPRAFTAPDDYLDIRPGSIGTYTFETGGFSNATISVYDVTDPASVRRIANAAVTDDGSSYSVSFNDMTQNSTRYVLSSGAGVRYPSSIIGDTGSSLRNTTNHADYVVICHDDFYDEIQPLAEYRRDQGLNVTVANLSDVYDEFNYGIAGPEAIKNFLNYTYTSWQAPAPVYVLLVGDGTYDYRDDEEWGFTNYVPSALVYNKDFGETSTDDWFVCFDGDDDILADMLIGRFPAKTEAEVSQMVNKTISYEAGAVNASWTKKVLFVADDEAAFEASCNQLSTQLDENYTATNLFLQAYTDPLDCKQDILSAMNGGEFLVTYAGHGGMQIWADEEILTVDDIPSLDNEGTYPFMLMLNCVNGHFIQPMYLECLAEELLRPEKSGAAAVFAPSGMSLPEHQLVLAEGLYDAIFKKGDRVLGSVVAEAKTYLVQEAGTAVPDVIQSFILFGDPALVLRMEPLPDEPEPESPAVFASSATIAPVYSFSVSIDAKATLPAVLFQNIGVSAMAAGEGVSLGGEIGALVSEGKGVLTPRNVQLSGVPRKVSRNGDEEAGEEKLSSSRQPVRTTPKFKTRPVRRKVNLAMKGKATPAIEAAPGQKSVEKETFWGRVQRVVARIKAYLADRFGKK